MKLYSENGNYKLYNGNMLDMLNIIESCSIDAIITDPPYELNFMGKGWDNSGIAFQADTWKRCFDALKSGGYLLAFGGSRTFHRIAVAIEDAGFEIRDVIMWLYGSGFPKSMNIGLAIDKKNGVESPVIGQNINILKKQAKDLRENKRKIVESFNAGSPERNNGFKTVSADIRQAQNEWSGWGTALKPSYEPIIIARKPCEGSCINNVLKYEVGGINIDECRIVNETLVNKEISDLGVMHDDNWVFDKETSSEVVGRFPANTILTYDETDFDEVCGGMPITLCNNGSPISTQCNNNINFNSCQKITHNGFGDSGSAARYFYCAKASKRDRDEGLDNFEFKIGGGMLGTANQSLLTGSGNIRNNMRKNTHPTVKPTSLMQYLVRLVTPKGGTVLDPFNGSGSTGKAVMYENKDRNANYKYIGIELIEEYLPITQARIEYAQKENN